MNSVINAASAMSFHTCMYYIPQFMGEVTNYKLQLVQFICQGVQLYLHSYINVSVYLAIMCVSCVWFNAAVEKTMTRAKELFLQMQQIGCYQRLTSFKRKYKHIYI